MDISKMKNIVVLKDLPSNIVDEAFVVLKSNKKIRNLEKIENVRTLTGTQDGKKDKNYVLKEAEMLVSDCIAKIEKKQENNNKNIKNKNISRIKTLAFFSSFMAILEAIIIFSN